jgi:antitoxin component of MazEF toxin-antitoxin module
LRARIAKWGNSLGIRIPKAVAKEVGLDEGTNVDLRVSGKNLVLAPAHREYSLQELVGAITPKNRHRETDWGAPVRQRVLVSAARYVPERGDLLWLTFDPQAGHEQAGRRPALVVSPAAYNRRANLALVCPITTQAKGYSSASTRPKSERA